MRDGVVFYRSFYEAIKKLPAEQFKSSALAILEYALDGKEPETDGIERTVFCMAKPQIDANNRRYENGTKGGRPKTKENQESDFENQTEHEFNQPITKQNQTETKPEPKEKDKVKDKEKVKEKDKEKNNNIGRFTPPDVKAVAAYCLERGNNVDPQAFVDFYESKGWFVGKNKMKDWKAAVRTWERNRTGQTRLEEPAKHDRISEVDSW